MKQSKKSADLKTSDTKKVIIVSVLFLTALAIAVSGAFFSVYSFVNNISFKVINTNVSGIIFGLVVMYLGIQYAISVKKLRQELYSTTAVFSWSNFKKQKTAKSR